MKLLHSATLLRRAREGDRAAMDELLADVRPYLMTLARDYDDPARASQSASDLVQEAELRAWQKLGDFNGAGGADSEEVYATFRSWIGRIVRRLGIDLRRMRSAQKRGADAGRLAIDPNANAARGRVVPGLESDAATASGRLVSAERLELINNAIATIPDASNREIVRLYFFEGLSLRLVAERLEMPHETVKKRYRSTLERLERALGKLREE